MSAESPETEAYLKNIEEEVEKAYKTAQITRQQCKDPEPDVEISLAADLASRVEGLLGFKGVAEKIREFNTNFSREEVALKIAEEISAGKIGTFEDKEKAIECAIRIALAILTEAVVAAPIEGISRVKIKENLDRTKYLAVYFAGPIRSAGGTAEAFTVLVGDKLRQLLNLDRYKPSEKEIERYIEEVELYETEAAHLQYPSTPDEIRFAVKNLPIEITGEPTDKIEVTGYRDLERVETNQVRGGAILVLVEGVLSKATKVAKLAEELKLEGWSWIKELAQKRVEKKSTKEPTTPKYLEDVIGGRPILAYPNQPGGFRLRYGRCRNSGLAAQSIHPATMVILDEFIAVGTQIKTERPGKAAAIVPCDTIEGPIVKLKTGDVIYVNTLEEAYKLKDQVAEILFLGDILISYGEFLENNHPLMPSGYCEEIWQQELEKVAKQSNTLDVYQIKMYIEDSIKNVPTTQEAIQLSEKFRIPLHPRYTYYWHDISAESILKLVDWIVSGEFSDSTLKLPISEEKKLLEMLGVPHKISNNLVTLDSNESQILLRCLGLDEKLSKQRFEEVYTSRSWADPVELVSALAGFPVRKKAPTKIGARMARPEKANMRMMKPAPHFLFPLGWAGGKTRNTIKATKNNTITVDIVYRKCPICKKTTFKPKCICGGRTRITSPSHKDQGLLIKDLLEEAAKNIHENIPEEIKGVVGLISRDKVPEPLEKGILRAKYDLHVFRDGTIRFDATNLPLTHFRPSEIKTDVEKLKQLGYQTDCHGKPLLNGDQIIELKQQDLVIPEKGGECLVKIAKFIDEMLAKFYNLPPYYNVNKIGDLVGHLVVGLAPHTSVGVIGRIIGFTRADACFAHPYFHAAKRRNCVQKNTNVVIWDEDRKQLIVDKIGKLVDDLINKHPNLVTADRYGFTIIKNPYNWFSYSINPNTRKFEKKRIKCFLRGPKQKEWIKITTTTNREFICTLDHRLLYIEGEKFKAKPALEAKVGDRVPISIDLPMEIKNPVKYLNLAKLLLEYNENLLFNIRIRKAEKFFKEIIKKDVLSIIGITKTKLRDNRYLRTMPLSFLAKLSHNKLFNFDDIPSDAKIAMSRDDFELPIYIPLNEELMRILGYYISEGHSRETGSAFQISFRMCKKETLNDLLTCIKNVFSIQPNISEGTKVTICSRILYLLFTKVWKIGKGAHTKKLPDFIYNLPERYIRAFLSAYFDGDGTAVTQPPRIAISSVSKSLMYDIGLLLLRFSIFSRYARSKPRLPGRKILDRYAELKKKPKCNPQYRLILYGKDMRAFAQLVKPINRMKKERVSNLAMRSGLDVRYIVYDKAMIPIPEYSDFTFDIVKKVKKLKLDENSYCLDIEGESIVKKNILWHNQMIQFRCDGDEDALMLLLDTLIDFSKHYLPESRGGKMDAPLVLTTRIDPAEVDDEAHNVDISYRYPLEFYYKTFEYANPSEVEQLIQIVAQRIGTPAQYEGFGFTHGTTAIDIGPTTSSYKTLKAMLDKVEAQLKIATKVRAVDQQNVALRVIEGHFLPDLYGNLRSFSKQRFRCVDCNLKFRRVPLQGKCTKCGGKLVLTVSRGTIEKYLQISMELTKNYGLNNYLQYRLELLKRSIESLFGEDPFKQATLADFM